MMSKIRVTYESYSSRDSRNKFIADIFSNYLTSSVINVGGGGEKSLLKYIRPTKYLEIDIAGAPDLKVDLDNDHPLPLQDGSAETIVCTDVLEHLDELHRVFKELLRISSRYVIISVPNAITEIRPYLTRREYTGVAGAAGREVGKFSKFYGLPSCKPCDRHRWFFSYTEAELFFRNLADELHYEVIEEVPLGAIGRTFAGSAARFIVKHVLGEDAVKDLFYNTYWCVLEKRAPDTVMLNTIR
jgi:SAM-dependent methyltransferase